MRMYWSAAEEFCVSKGGHLVSVSSPFHLQKLYDFIARNRLSDDILFLGGTYKKIEGEWSWSDGSKWSVEHWEPGQGRGGSGQNCLVTDKNVWWDKSCSDKFRSICSLPTTKTLNSDTQLVFTSKNISSTPAIQVRWVAEPLSQKGGREENEEIHAQNKSQSDQSGKQIPGFKLNWKLKGVTNDAEAQYVWKAKNQQNSNERDLNVMSIMNLVRESKIKGIRESEIWKKFFQHRWDIEILKTNSCLTENQTAEMIYKIGQDLNLNYGSSLWIPEEDIR